MASDTQSEAYAKAQGLPTTWNREDQGYVAKYCDYYTTEPYRNAHFEEYFIFIREFILVTFIFTNILILTVILKCGCQKLNRSIHSNSAPVYWAIAIAMGIMNLIYLIGLIWAHTCKRLPHLLLDESSTHIENCPAKLIYYQHELLAFIAKVSTLFISAIMELILALYMTNFRLLPIPPILAQVMKRCFCCCNYLKCLQTVLLWQVFLFMQILLGVLPLPFFVLFIFSPLRSILTLSIVALLFILLTASMSHMLYNCRIRCTCTSWMNFVFWFWAYTVITAPIAGIMGLYITFVDGGYSDSGIKPVILSLLPSVLLSGSVWVIKKKFMNKRTSPHLERQPSVSSVATEEEEIDLDYMEQGIALDNSTETPHNNVEFNSV